MGKSFRTGFFVLWNVRLWNYAIKLFKSSIDWNKLLFSILKKFHLQRPCDIKSVLFYISPEKHTYYFSIVCCIDIYIC